MINFEKDIHLPSPVQLIEDALLDKKKIKLYIKRDDLIHPSVGGNKFRKTKYNLLKMKELGFNKILTFGGAFSNHIYAVAALGKLFNIETIGVIRGEKTAPLSSTLVFAENSGMRLIFIDRKSFKNRDTVLKNLETEYKDAYWLPDGGSNVYAIDGCQEIVKEIDSQLPIVPDYFCTACGTGGTIAGISKALKEPQKVLGFPVLKNDKMLEEIAALINAYQPQEPSKIDNIMLHTDYHFGGYAKWKPELIEFINTFKIKYGIPLDPVYTGKLFYGLFDLINKDYFTEGASIIAVHTGGLQGIEGFNQLKLKNAAYKIV